MTRTRLAAKHSTMACLLAIELNSPALRISRSTVPGWMSWPAGCALISRPNFCCRSDLKECLSKSSAYRADSSSMMIEYGRLTGVAVQDLPRRVKSDIALEIEVEHARAMLENMNNRQEAEVEAFNRRQATAIEDLQ